VLGVGWRRRDPRPLPRCTSSRVFFGSKWGGRGGGEFLSRRPPFPPPPTCLHESGGFASNRGDESRLTRSIQAAARQEVATTTRAPVKELKNCRKIFNFVFDSRRLHHSTRARSGRGEWCPERASELRASRRAAWPSRRPVRLVYSESHPTRTVARKQERQALPSAHQRRRRPLSNFSVEFAESLRDSDDLQALREPGKQASGTVVLGYTVSYLVVRRLPALNHPSLTLAIESVSYGWQACWTSDCGLLKQPRNEDSCLGSNTSHPRVFRLRE
jgi:hypothetical protein